MKNPLTSPVFEKRVSFLCESQFWPKDKMDAYQLSQLQELVAHVERHVPFYRDFMRTHNFTHNDIGTLTDLKRFPVIDKKIIQKDYRAFIPDYLEQDKLYHRSTGGSTGTPLTVYADEDFFARDKANTEYYMRVFDLDIFNYRSIRLYGDKVDEALIKQGLYWYEVEDRKLVMSCYHISAQTAEDYVKKINDYKPDYIHTRPSSILPLAQYIKTLGLKLNHNIRYIFCDGEYLTSGQRQIIEKQFNTRLNNIYGHTEACVFGHPCKDSQMLHFAPQVGILEVLGPNGRDVITPGEKGEMITTGFNNPAFPLIRYRTGDIGIMAEQACPCNRPYKILQEIEGRMQDYVVDAAGNIAPLAPAVFNYNDMDWKGIHEFRVVQEEQGRLFVLIQPEKDCELSPADIGTRIGSIMGEGFTVNVKLVDSIQKTKIGKHRYLDQKLDLSQYFRADAV